MATAMRVSRVGPQTAVRARSAKAVNAPRAARMSVAVAAAKLPEALLFDCKLL